MQSSKRKENVEISIRNVIKSLFLYSTGKNKWKIRFCPFSNLFKNR